MRVREWGTQFGRLERKPDSLWILVKNLLKNASLPMLFSRNFLYNPTPHVHKSWKNTEPLLKICLKGSDPEPVFINVYGAQESIPRNELRQPM